MNDRIKQLQVLSGLQAYYDSQQSDIDKFAELIIKECLYAVEGSNDRYRKDYFAGKIRDHFGVE